jgi:hypothetical protein
MNCNYCNTFKAFPDEFIYDNNTYDIDKCNECRIKHIEQIKFSVEKQTIKCECGCEYYCPTDIYERLHKTTLKHKRIMAKLKKFIDIDLLTREKLFIICKANNNPDGTSKLPNYTRMKVKELRDKLKDIPDLIIPDELTIK